MSGVRLGRVFRGKMRLRVTIALVVLLLLVVGVSAFIYSQRLDTSSVHAIEVYMDEMLAGRIDPEWLARLESVQVEIRGEKITCVSLIDALESVGARPTSHETVTIEGEGAPVLIPAGSILAQWSSYIVYEVDAEPLSPENGGPYRIMVLQADGTDLSINGVRRIAVQLME